MAIKPAYTIYRLDHKGNLWYADTLHIDHEKKEIIFTDDLEVSDTFGVSEVKTMDYDQLEKIKNKYISSGYKLIVKDGAQLVDGIENRIPESEAKKLIRMEYSKEKLNICCHFRVMRAQYYDYDVIVEGIKRTEERKVSALYFQAWVTFFGRAIQESFDMKDVAYNEIMMAIINVLMSYAAALIHIDDKDKGKIQTEADKSLNALKLLDEKREKILAKKNQKEVNHA